MRWLFLVLSIFPGTIQCLNCYSGSSDFKTEASCSSDVESCLTILPFSESKLNQAKFECGDENKAETCTEVEGETRCYCTTEYCNHSNDLLMCYHGVNNDAVEKLCNPGVTTCSTKIKNSTLTEYSCGKVAASGVDEVEGCFEGTEYAECLCQSARCNTEENIYPKCYYSDHGTKKEGFCAKNATTCLTSRNKNTGANEFSCGISNQTGCADLSGVGLGHMEECHCSGNLCNNAPLDTGGSGSLQGGDGGAGDGAGGDGETFEESKKNQASLLRTSPNWTAMLFMYVLMK